ncbi:hypothetical protein Mp_8g15480 [Marchantia polymorpha subsp. ruderalis]|uniref:Uncharacterized protein n=1 Tax=Marchantia polymorpha TaxID=3197 RepID=A0A2R6WL76_MARPO|nr:hypothetical protein MARPO_0079s0065 [Marchantia polymorpha]BBN19990.1 hypothetical protein Mp_8g15480 [Marchantia polymorpha subsp. ruderalis]|eukprot:PTQ34563.1 hypothetical protein MARPO_0079s0065 [Marchantia polymorpha]
MPRPRSPASLLLPRRRSLTKLLAKLIAGPPAERNRPSHQAIASCSLVSAGPQAEAAADVEFPKPNERSRTHQSIVEGRGRREEMKPLLPPPLAAVCPGTGRSVRSSWPERGSREGNK